jgi:hypothetical protein
MNIISINQSIYPTPLIERSGKNRNKFTSPMVLLGDEAQLEACFGPFGDSANHDAR